MPIINIKNKCFFNEKHCYIIYVYSASFCIFVIRTIEYKNINIKI